MGYQCWGEDHEDLTEKVKEAIASLPAPSGGAVVYGLRRTAARREPRRVLVSCTKGHENVFEIED